MFQLSQYDGDSGVYVGPSRTFETDGDLGKMQCLKTNVSSSLKFIFFKSYFHNIVSLIIAYLFGEYEDINVQSANVAEEHSPIAVDPVSGVLIEWF